MAIKTLFPAEPLPRPAGVTLSPVKGERLRFTVSTNSPAPIFVFSVDAVPQWDPGSAPHRSTATQNIYSWEHPTGVFGNNQLQDLFFKALLLPAETYEYLIEKLDSTGAATKLVEESMTGTGVERSDFMLGLL